jgi:mRNA-degrading endonuclease RelE of RelBE toxin-antitoxin system
MSYTIIYLPKAEKYLTDLDDKNYNRIEESIEEIRKNPYRKRPKADILKLGGYSSPPMYRLRVGRHRLEYFVDESDKVIQVVDAFLRSSDSDYR